MNLVPCGAQMNLGIVNMTTLVQVRKVILLPSEVVRRFRTTAYQPRIGPPENERLARSSTDPVTPEIVRMPDQLEEVPMNTKGLGQIEDHPMTVMRKRRYQHVQRTLEEIHHIEKGYVA